MTTSASGGEPAPRDVARIIGLGAGRTCGRTVERGPSARDQQIAASPRAVGKDRRDAVLVLLDAQQAIWPDDSSSPGSASLQRPIEPRPCGHHARIAARRRPCRRPCRARLRGIATPSGVGAVDADAGLSIATSASCEPSPAPRPARSSALRSNTSTRQPAAPADARRTCRRASRR